MVRWEPGARERLQKAALELYAARGFEQTTAADIAESVGLSERTFFRHFADKREVIFNGQALFEQAFVDGISSASPGSPALDVVAAALEAAGSFFPDERRGYSRLRQSIIVANPSLHERELLKMTALSTRIAAGLREHGIPEPQATLAAQSGATVFHVAFGQWIAEGETRSLPEIEREILGELRSVTQESA
ncbi:TetR family transcriptional regulator [Frondihabitans cladoniiphilus]|uniref:TetR family transcriptional regulator n=1 Tax=Frondihabitans cladoniiphilus TaxID=715785 RepID=A0ABP8VPT5_9MICO